MVEISEQRFGGTNAGMLWRDMIADLFGVGESFIGDDRRFSGKISYCNVGQIELSRVISSCELSRRTNQHIKGSSFDGYILVNGLDGEVKLTQGARKSSIVSQSFVFYCTSRPCEWEHRDFTDVRNVVIPAPLLRSRLRNADRFIGHSFQGATGMWQVLSDTMDSLFRHLPQIPHEASYQLGAQLVDLLTLALETTNGDLSFGETSSRTAIHQRCVRYIRSNISDDGLTPNTIAAGLGMSLRSLHRVFNENNTTVSECIRDERLGAAARELHSPANTNVAISEIACRCGFRNNAHFASSFKSKFGMSPSAWRRETI